MITSPQDLHASEAIILDRSQADLEKMKTARKILTEVTATAIENEVIDIHGFDREDALSAFLERERIIIDGLKLGTLAANKGKYHYFKLICGFGHHSKDQDENKKNRYFFEQYLTNQGYNFAYFDNHGVFLIRYHENGAKN